MDSEKKPYVPQLFDRVYNDIYGYGIVIGVENPDEFDPIGYNALVLFDKADEALHAGGAYRECCESWIDVPYNGRKTRCYWCEVQELSTYLDTSTRRTFRDDIVCLVPFASLEYKKHPIRVVCTLPHLSVFTATIDHINTKGAILIFSDAYGYCLAKKENLSFNEELLGTVSDVWINEEVEEDADDDVGEDTVDSPSYYKTARLEPNELMSDLMSFEQHEGFLWGNIIKYAYRYGKKGEKAETVKKIRKYCDMLLEILEPKNELED